MTAMLDSVRMSALECLGHKRIEVTLNVCANALPSVKLDRLLHG